MATYISFFCVHKNKLVIDEYANNIVRNIYRWKIEGMNNQKIADRLNDKGVLTPLEYKNSLGYKCYTPFKKKDVCKWSFNIVGRIHKNEVG